MGDPRRLRKKYETPNHPWQKARIVDEKQIMSDFGLKNKREIWRAQSDLRRYRHLARDLVALGAEERKTKQEALIGKLERLGILPKGAGIDEVLLLKVEDVLKRRLQTLVWKATLARTSEQARQFITHGHIAINGRKITSPGMIVSLENEKLIGWYGEPVKLDEGKERLGSFKEAVPDVAEKDTIKKALDAEAEVEAGKVAKKIENESGIEKVADEVKAEEKKTEKKAKKPKKAVGEKK